MKLASAIAVGLAVCLVAAPAFACVVPTYARPHQVADLRRLLDVDDNVYLVEAVAHVFGLSQAECDQQEIEGTCRTWQEFRSLSADHILRQFDWQRYEPLEDHTRTLFVLNVVEVINGDVKDRFLAPGGFGNTHFNGNVHNNYDDHSDERFWTLLPDDPANIERAHLPRRTSWRDYVNEPFPIRSSCSAGPVRYTFLNHGIQYLFFERYFEYFRGGERIAAEDDRWLEYIRLRYEHLRRGEEYDPLYPADGGTPTYANWQLASGSTLHPNLNEVRESGDLSHRELPGIGEEDTISRLHSERRDP